MLGLCTIKTMKLILVICALVSLKFVLFQKITTLLTQLDAASAETWKGEGNVRCYGDMNIEADETRQDWIDAKGIAHCTHWGKNGNFTLKIKLKWDRTDFWSRLP